MRSPAWLFRLRMFPYAFSSLVVFGLVLPSFLLLEPRQTRETPELYLIVLASVSVMVFVAVGLRLLLLLSATRTFCMWQRSAKRIDIATPIPVFWIEAPASLFAVAGVFNPRVFIGREALASLSREELDAALIHEVAHVRSLDNLKRLLLFVTRFPRCLSHLNALDACWSEAVELAADEEALKSPTSALELGSAIIKIGRLQSMEMPPMVSCHLVTSGEPSAMAIRLERLRFRLDNPIPPPAKSPRLCARVLVASIVIGYLLALPSALEFTHKTMEWLVR